MGIRTDRLLGFSGPREYLQAMAHAPQTILRRFFLTKSVEEQRADADEGGAPMKCVLVRWSTLEGWQLPCTWNRVGWAVPH